MKNVIEVSGLTKTYGDLTAVDAIDLAIPEGCCFGLLGPNGAGKTTTIEMLEGIVKPTAGEIRLFGDVASKKLYRRVGIQFQNTALQDYLTVVETLTLFASFYDQPADIDSLLDLCVLRDFAHQDARKLSGGQRQRLLLALALVNQPDLVFLDEPTTGLDPQARRNFWDLVNEIKAQGKSIVLTTHYMDEAEILCDEIAIMDRGNIIAEGTPETLLKKHFDGVMVLLPESNLSDKTLPFSVLKNGELVEVLTRSVDETLNQLMQMNIPLEGMQVKQPNLDDLFLKLTGHALRG